MKKKTLDATFFTAAVLGSLVLANVLGLGLFGRLDLTRDKEFTLSRATRQTLSELKDPVTVRAYFTRELPPPYATSSRYVKDLLEEYYAAAGGNLRFEFVDPQSEETEKDKEKKKEVRRDIFGREVREETSVEKELRTLGIPPVQVRVREGDRVEEKRAYMGIVVRFGDRKEVIPVVGETAGLEYDLTTLIRKVAREKHHKVALLGGHELQDPAAPPDPGKGLARLEGLLGQLYDVERVDLTKTPQLADDVQALLVIAPATPLSEQEQRAIDRFVLSGRSAAFLLGPVAPDLRTMSVKPLDSGLAPLLATWGVKVQPGLVLDAECATMNVSQQRGFMQITQPVKYPFIPLPKALDEKHPLTRGLSQIAFPFMGPLELALPEGGQVSGDVLVRSSKNAWIQNEPFNLDPLQRWTRDLVKDEGEKALFVAVQGALPSHFERQDSSTASGEQEPKRAQNARVLVAGGHSFVQDEFLSKGNEALILNLLDWLVQEDSLLAVRARGLAAAPLDDKLSDTTRSGLRFANVLGVPALLVALGVVRWRWREGRRAKAKLD